MTAVDVDALDKLREALALAYSGRTREAFDAAPESWRQAWFDDTEDLLPVVDRIANERAAAALEAAADWLEADPDTGGAPLITGNFSVLFADPLDIAQAVSWAGASLRDKGASLRDSNGAGTT